MKKRFLVSAVLFLFFFILPKAQNVWDGSVAETYAGGNGSEENPYQISNGAELAKLSQDVNNGMTFKDVFFELTDDIILNKDVMDENGNITMNIRYIKTAEQTHSGDMPNERNPQIHIYVLEI